VNITQRERQTLRILKTKKKGTLTAEKISQRVNKEVSKSKNWLPTTIASERARLNRLEKKGLVGVDYGTGYTGINQPTQWFLTGLGLIALEPKAKKTAKPKARR
jgi:DNA-binding response OmpR family regulator